MYYFRLVTYVTPLTKGFRDGFWSRAERVDKLLFMQTQTVSSAVGRSKKLKKACLIMIENHKNVPMYTNNLTLSENKHLQMFFNKTRF